MVLVLKVEVGIEGSIYVVFAEQVEGVCPTILAINEPSLYGRILINNQKFNSIQIAEGQLHLNELRRHHPLPLLLLRLVTVIEIKE